MDKFGEALRDRFLTIEEITQLQDETRRLGAVATDAAKESFHGQLYNDERQTKPSIAALQYLKSNLDNGPINILKIQDAMTFLGFPRGFSGVYTLKWMHDFPDLCRRTPDGAVLFDFSAMVDGLDPILSDIS